MRTDENGSQTEVFFVCADDAHGAPIMIAAQAAGLSPKEFTDHIGRGRSQYIEGFHIQFDNWYTTDSHENKELAESIYKTLRSGGHISTRMIEQFFDPVGEMFLPDRYIKGTCPNCGASEQFGDACEKCGAVYSATELIGPRSALTGALPVRRSSLHFFFDLSSPSCVEFLREWTQTAGRLQPEVVNKVSEWLGSSKSSQTLRDWDISRDAPYFGIEIPDAPGKYFYVWLDAPVGYLASLKNYLNRIDRDFDSYISDPEVEQVHFIGKDIITFHTLFWPAMLFFSDRKVPTTIAVHGHLTVNGEKMSKSRGTGLSPLRYLELGLDPEWLRYYFASKLNARVEDADFVSHDFVTRVNSDLIGKYVNIASRLTPFLASRFASRLTEERSLTGQKLLDDLAGRREYIESQYEEREFSRVVREVMHLADRTNEYIDAHRPWELAKKEGHEIELHEVASIGIEAFRILTIYLRPILPELAARVEEFLLLEPQRFRDVERRLGAQTIGVYSHLMKRADMANVNKLFPPPVT